MTLTRKSQAGSRCITRLKGALIKDPLSAPKKGAPFSPYQGKRITAEIVRRLDAGPTMSELRRALPSTGGIHLSFRPVSIYSMRTWIAVAVRRGVQRRFGSLNDGLRIRRDHRGRRQRGVM